MRIKIIIVAILLIQFKYNFSQDFNIEYLFERDSSFILKNVEILLPSMTPGKCFVKTKVPKRYAEFDFSFNKYKPKYKTDLIENIKDTSITIIATETIWLKDKQNLNNKLVELDNSISLSGKITLDTTKLGNFEKITLVQKKLISKEGYGFVEIICKQNVNQKLIFKIISRLIELEYLPNKPIESFDEFDLKWAISNYQKDIYHPFEGLLLMITLKELDVL